MLQPRRTKFRRVHKMKMKGNAQRGAQLAYGTFGIKAMDGAWITARQIEAARIAATRYMKREGQLWINYKIRRYLEARLSKGGISRIFIERTLKLVTVTITTARPGLIIGKGGQEVDKLKEELKKLTGKDVQINIFEIKRI